MRALLLLLSFRPTHNTRIYFCPLLSFLGVILVLPAQNKRVSPLPHSGVRGLLIQYNPSISPLPLQVAMLPNFPILPHSSKPTLSTHLTNPSYFGLIMFDIRGYDLNFRQGNRKTGRSLGVLRNYKHDLPLLHHLHHVFCSCFCTRHIPAGPNYIYHPRTTAESARTSAAAYLWCFAGPIISNFILG